MKNWTELKKVEDISLYTIIKGETDWYKCYCNTHKTASKTIADIEWCIAWLYHSESWCIECKKESWKKDVH